MNANTIRHGIRRTALAAAVSVFAAAPAAFAAPGDPLAPPFPVDPGQPGGGPIVRHDAAGDFLVVWSGQYPTIRARLFNANGSAHGPAFSVASGSLSGAAMNAAGEFVISWGATNSSGATHTYVQRYAAGGAPTGTPIDALPYGSSSVAMDADGDFVLTWDGSRQIGIPGGLPYLVFELGFSTVKAQRFSHDGTRIGGNLLVHLSLTDPLPINGSLNPPSPTVVMNSDGDFIVAWNDNTLILKPSVYARRYGKSGLPLGLEFRVNPLMPSSAGGPNLAMGDDGSFIASWQTPHPVGTNSYSGADIYARRFTRLGLPTGQPIAVSTNVVTGGQSLARDAAGNFAVAWIGTTSSGCCIPSYLYLRTFAADGTQLGSVVNVTGPNVGLDNPALVMNASGNLVLGWNEAGNVEAELFAGP